MALPISYNIRNLIERKTTTLLTALGIALPVAILLVVLALVAGLQEAFQASGSPQHVLVLRKGTNAELNSSVSRQQYQDIKFKRGIAPLKNGEPAASLENPICPTPQTTSGKATPQMIVKAARASRERIVSRNMLGIAITLRGR